MRIPDFLKRRAERLINLATLVTRPMTLGVRALVRDGEGRIFLVKHSYLPGWYLPGGGVDPGETVERAVRRELVEEGGIVAEGPVELFGIYQNLRASGRNHVVLYVVDRFALLPPPYPNREIVEAGFFARESLPPDTTPATRARLAEVLDGAPRPEIW